MLSCIHGRCGCGQIDFKFCINTIYLKYTETPKIRLFIKLRTNGSECQKRNLIGIFSKFEYFLMLEFTDLVVDTNYEFSHSTEFQPQFLLIDKKSNQLISSAQTALVQHNQWKMSACPPVCFGSELGMCECASMCGCVCAPGQQTNIVHHNYQFGVQLLFAAIINVRQFANALPSCLKALPQLSSAFLPIPAFTPPPPPFSTS